MNQDHLFIRFVLNKSKTNKMGVCPIYCRVTYAKKRAQFTTSEFVNPNNWNSKEQRLLSTDNKSKLVNTQLELLHNKIKKEYLSLQLKGEKFDVDEIVFNLQKESKEVKETYVIACFQDYLIKLKKLVGKDIELGTWKKYDYSCKHTAKFIQWKFKKRDYPIKDLKLQFLHDFEYYLKTEANHNQATLNKIIQRFRKPIRIAVGEGILEKDPFYLYKANRVKKEVVFLSEDELNLIEEHRFVQKRLEIVRDLFVFCCYTGLAYNEMNKLERENLVKGFDKKLWIKIVRKKTGGTVSVPLLSKAIEIIEKYKTETQLLPRYTNQKINSYLKEIADIIGIRKRITHHTARKTFASTVLLYNNVPMEIVSELLGHSSIKITQEYYGKIVQKRISEEMKRISIKYDQSKT